MYMLTLCSIYICDRPICLIFVTEMSIVVMVAIAISLVRTLYFKISKKKKKKCYIRENVGKSPLNSKL